jgi:hypothetical protein
MRLLLPLRNTIGTSFEVNYKPSRNFDVPINILSITKAKLKLVIIPPLIYQEGIRTWNG